MVRSKGKQKVGVTNALAGIKALTRGELKKEFPKGIKGEIIKAAQNADIVSMRLKDLPATQNGLKKN